MRDVYAALLGDACRPGNMPGPRPNKKAPETRPGASILLQSQTEAAT